MQNSNYAVMSLNNQGKRLKFFEFGIKNVKKSW